MYTYPKGTVSVNGKFREVSRGIGTAPAVRLSPIDMGAARMYTCMLAHTHRGQEMADPAKGERVRQTGWAECEGIPGPCRWCGSCREWWPLSEDFWYWQEGRGGRKGRWQSRCRACCVEWTQEARAARKSRRGAEGGAK